MNKTRKQIQRGVFLILALFLLHMCDPASTASAAGIVNPKQIYTYEIMEKDMRTLVKRYPELMTMSSLGTSEYNRELWCLTIGKGPAVILLNGSHHAREWMTTNLLMKMAEYYGESYVRNASYDNLKVKDLLDHVTVVIVPMVNPDGVTLQQKGLSAFPQVVHASLIQMNEGSRNFARWKANAKGIDLNRQYPAGWDSIRNNRPSGSYMNYKGSTPLQAKEAAIMATFTREIMPQLAISYHSAGEIIYWNYKTKSANLARDRAIAQRYANLTGYRLISPSPNPSGGGFTDWFITEFGRPAITPEISRVVSGQHVPLGEWDRIWRQHQGTAWMIVQEGYKLWMNTQILEAAPAEIYLTARETLYQYPGFKEKPVGTAVEGLYKQIHTKGNWVQIQNGKDKGWISSRAVLQNITAAGEENILLFTKDTALHASPLQTKPLSLRYADQKFKILLAWQDWYLADTPKVPRWVKADQVWVVSTIPAAEIDPGTPEAQDEEAGAGNTVDQTEGHFQEENRR